MAHISFARVPDFGHIFLGKGARFFRKFREIYRKFREIYTGFSSQTASHLVLESIYGLTMGYGLWEFISGLGTTRRDIGAHREDV